MKIVTTFRCPRRCLLGYVIDVPGAGRVLTNKDGATLADMQPGQPHVDIGCRHVVGGLRPKHLKAAPGTVVLTQDDVRTASEGELFGWWLSPEQSKKLLSGEEES